MKHIPAIISIVLICCGFKTPETSSLFDRCTDPETGVVSYVLKPGIIDYNQQGFYFVNKSMTDDGRFLLFQTCADWYEGEPALKTYAVIDFEQDKAYSLGIECRHGLGYLDVKANKFYYATKSKKICCRDLNSDPMKEIFLCNIPKELTEEGKLKMFCTHMTLTPDRKFLFADTRVDDRFLQGLINLETGEYVPWCETDFYINHGQMNPVRDDIALCAFEGRWTDKYGVSYWIRDVKGPYPRLQLFRPGQKPQMVPSMTGYATHECWTNDGKGFYWCSNGVVLCDLETGKQEKVSPYGDHAKISDDLRYVVSDIRIAKFYRGEGWKLYFHDRQTGKGIFICSMMPPSSPETKPSKIHPDPHPSFVCNDKYIVYTKTAWGHRVNLAITPVQEVIDRMNTKWLGDLPEHSDPLKVYRKLTRQLISCDPEAYGPAGYDGKTPVGNGKQIHYSTNSAYVNAMQIAYKVADKALLDSVIRKFAPFVKGNKRHLRSIDCHVDHSIFGAIACEVNMVRGGDDYKNLGLYYADHQWAKPDKVQPYVGGNAPYEKQMEYYRDGYSPQTRLWIDDMYMINVLQTQAYRITGDPKYIERAAREMVLYLKELQQPDGLFFHATGKNFVWGRGDGWMAAGMPMILQYLTPDSEYYAPIMEGYLKMMKALLKWQRKNGLWGQLVNDRKSWDETSCSAMFTFGFIQGVKHGWLDEKTYGPAARKAWITLTGMLDEYGNLPGVCIGTGARNERQWYIDRPRVNGDPHGQAPMLWICNALL